MLKFLVLLLCAVSCVLSWTYIPVSDFNLVKTSDVIIYGNVKEELVEAPYPSNRVYRYYKVDIEDKIMGQIGNNQNLIVRALGGYDPSTETIYGFPGSPVLSTNEKVLLFLRASDNANVYDFMHFGLGSFHELLNGELSYAYRVSDVAEDKNSLQLRKMKDFIRWIRLVASSIDLASVPTYWSDLSANADTFWSSRQEIHKRYNTMKTSGGYNVKWQTFTQGGTVNWNVNPRGAPALSGGGYEEIQQAFAAWNTATPDVTNVIKYQYIGNTTASGGLATSDSQNSVIYEDPNNEIPGTFNCNTGGTLAVGGWKAKVAMFSWRGLSWLPITEADMVVQDGIACWISSSSSASANWANMLTHEFGHTLAMGHSCGDTASGACVTGSAADLATMRAYLRNGVGPTLGDDDKAGINFLYASCWPNCTEISTPTSTSSSTGGAGNSGQSTTQSSTSTSGPSTTGKQATTGQVTTAAKNFFPFSSASSLSSSGQILIVALLAIFWIF